MKPEPKNARIARASSAISSRKYEVGVDEGISGDTIHNYIALTKLVPELQQMVDDRKIAITPVIRADN